MWFPRSNLSSSSVFDEIALIDSSSKLSDIIRLKEEKDAPESQNSGYFSSFFSQSKPIPVPSKGQKRSISHRELKLLRKKFKRWTESLEAQLDQAESSLHTQDGKNTITKLQQDVHRTFCSAKLGQNKLFVIRQILEERGIDDVKTDRAFEKLNMVIHRIQRTGRVYQTFSAAGNHPHSFLFGGMSFPGAIPCSMVGVQASILNRMTQERNSRIKKSRSLPHIPIKGNVEQAAITPLQEKEIRSIYAQSKQQEVQNLFARSTCQQLTPQKHPDWEIKIHHLFVELQGSDQIKNLCKTLNAMQAISVIKFFMQDPVHHWKLPYAICSLHTKVLQELLVAYDVESIRQLHVILRNCNAESIKWMNTEFCIITQDFIDICNEEKGEIDKLTRKFRLEPRNHTISNADLAPIKTLLSDILIHWEAATKLRLLFNEVVEDTQVHDDLIDLNNEYDTLVSRVEDRDEDLDLIRPEYSDAELKRLAEETKEMLTKIELLAEMIEGIQDKNLRMELGLHIQDISSRCKQHLAHVKREVGGNVFGIIHNKFFRPYDREDSDPAFECLGDWNIWNADDWREVGLLPQVNSLTFNLLKEKNISALFKNAESNLQKLGIRIVKDWKRLQIYNREMLKEYLSQPSIIAKLQQ